MGSNNLKRLKQNKIKRIKMEKREDIWSLLILGNNWNKSKFLYWKIKETKNKSEMKTLRDKMRNNKYD